MTATETTALVNNTKKEEDAENLRKLKAYQGYVIF